MTIVKSSICAVVGIAPAGPTQALTLCLSPDDDAQFGVPAAGFNIPRTLAIIRGIAGNCPVIVVNTFDQATNTTPVANESQQLVNGLLSLSNAPVGAVTISNADGTASALVEGTDYSIDGYGNLTALSGNMTNGTSYKFSYSYLNGGAVTGGQIIGGVDPVTEVRTGLALLAECYTTFGYNPKILITPLYSTLSSVAVAFAAAADTYRAMYIQDAPAGATVATVIGGRGPAGAINFNTADPRVDLRFPQLQVYDANSNTNIDFPFSAFMAGVYIANDNSADGGYWQSPSNQPIPMAVGLERPISWSINDAGSDANQLNAAGINTVATGNGTGILAWGNRNASFPNSSSVKNFINVQRTDDIIAESMELGALPFIDKGITQAFIDNVCAAGNALMKVLIGRGALMPGSRVVYNPADNPASQLAAGQVCFEKIYMVPTPAERITFYSIIDITLLNSLNS